MLPLSCQKQQGSTQKKRFYRMDTIVDITVVCKTEKIKKSIDKVWAGIDSLLSDWEIRFSQTKNKSEVLAINTQIEARDHVSEILIEMLDMALRYGDTLNGAFDITILPIKELWGFGEDKEEKIVPSKDTLTKTLALVNYKNIIVHPKKRTVEYKDTNTVLDVGGIAKGFSLREMAKLLDNYNITDYLIVAGGDIAASGKRQDGKTWTIGIQHPRNNEKPLGVFRLDSGSVVTSGDYERFWIKDGKRVHHIFDVNTGYSCTKNQSLTIWAPDPIIADILSTGLFCMAADSILSFVEKRKMLECVLVDSVGVIRISSGWKESVRILNN